ncbi:MAG: hypothetical protein WCO44_14110 [Bacteroidota bacterium]
MARQVINIGLVPGDKRGDKLRIGGIKINENFMELYNWLSAVQSVPVIAGYHLISEQEVNQLASIHVIIPAPGAGKVTELVSMIARVTPSPPPTGNLQIYPSQTLNVTTDGDTETQDWGYFPSMFLMSPDETIQRMTPVLSTQLFENSPLYVCLSGGENPKSGGAHIELYYLYRIIDLSGVINPGGGSSNNAQTVQSFVNQSEITVDHNLHKYPVVVVVDTTGRELVAEVTHVSTDQMVVRLNPAASGKIIYS